MEAAGSHELAATALLPDRPPPPLPPAALDPAPRPPACACPVLARLQVAQRGRRSARLFQGLSPRARPRQVVLPGGARAAAPGGARGGGQVRRCCCPAAALQGRQLHQAACMHALRAALRAVLLSIGLAGWCACSCPTAALAVCPPRQTNHHVPATRRTSRHAGRSKVQYEGRNITYHLLTKGRRSARRGCCCCAALLAAAARSAGPSPC